MRNLACIFALLSIMITIQFQTETSSYLIKHWLSSFFIETFVQPILIMILICYNFEKNKISHYSCLQFSLSLISLENLNLYCNIFHDFWRMSFKLSFLARADHQKNILIFYYQFNTRPTRQFIIIHIFQFSNHFLSSNPSNLI